MAMKNLARRVSPQLSLPPAARTASANGTGSDLSGYNSCAIVFSLGALTDGTHTPSVQHSDDNTTFGAVGSSDVTTVMTAMTANSVQRTAYVGPKRYVRAVLTVAGATTGALSSALIVRGDPAQAPTP